MYNYSGVWFRIWGVCGIILLVGILCVVLEKPWQKGFDLNKYKLGLGIVAFAICLSLFYGTRILFPDVSSYTGTFMSTNRNSRVAPPLPVTNEYVFWDGNGNKKVFYLDAFSKKVVCPSDFELGKEYTIVFDKLTKVIIRVDVVEYKTE